MRPYDFGGTGPVRCLPPRPAVSGSCGLEPARIGDGICTTFLQKINGETDYLWRAVDHEREVLESSSTSSRVCRAARKFLGKSMKPGGQPQEIVTDKLRSHGAAMKVLGNAEKKETGRCLKNRAENSHLPIRRRERAMLCFRQSSEMAQRLCQRSSRSRAKFFLLTLGQIGDQIGAVCKGVSVIDCRKHGYPPLWRKAVGIVVLNEKHTARAGATANAGVVGQIAGSGKRTDLGPSFDPRDIHGSERSGCPQQIDRMEPLIMDIMAFRTGHAALLARQAVKDFERDWKVHILRRPLPQAGGRSPRGLLQAGWRCCRPLRTVPDASSPYTTSSLGWLQTGA